MQDGTEGQPSAEEEEARKIAEMGKPILGEHSRLEVVIEESYEFKVLCTISFILFLFLQISSFVFVAPWRAAGYNFSQDQKLKNDWMTDDYDIKKKKNCSFVETLLHE